MLISVHYRSIITYLIKFSGCPVSLVYYDEENTFPCSSHIQICTITNILYMVVDVIDGLKVFSYVRSLDSYRLVQEMLIL